MRRLFRFAFRMLVIVMVLAVAALLLLDTIVREVAEQRIRQRTGLDARIGRMRIGLAEPRLTIEDLVIYNRGEFGGGPLLRVPELHVEYDRDSLWSHKLHCKLVRLNIAQLNIVEDKHGRLNLDALQDYAGKHGGPLLTTNKTSTSYQFTGIDTLNLTLGRAEFMSMKDPGKVDVLKMDMQNHVLLDVKSPDDLSATVALIKMKNHISVMGKVTDDANEVWQHWFEKLGLRQKK